MATSANMVWEVQTGGNDNNGGGFVTGASGTDYSQQTAAQATLTTASTVHTTTTQVNVDAGDYTVSTNDVGNTLQIHGGTATADVYEITAVDTGNNRWTLDKSAGTSGQTVVGNMGGCFATPGMIAELTLVSGQKAWIKGGNYTITTSTVGRAGPCLIYTNNSSRSICVEGYGTTRGDRDESNRPILKAGSVTSVTLWGFDGEIGDSGSSWGVCLEADGENQTGVNGFTVSESRGLPGAILCKASNCDRGFNMSETRVIECEADSCTTGFYGAVGDGLTENCWAHECGRGFEIGEPLVNCIASGCTGYGFYIRGLPATLTSCVAYDNGDNGFHFYQWDSIVLAGCISVNNTGYGFRLPTYDGGSAILWRCAAHGNSSGSVDGTNALEDLVTITGDPFEDGANNDFRLNNTVNQGAELRGLRGVGGTGRKNQDLGAECREASGGTTLVGNRRHAIFGMTP